MMTCLFCVVLQDVTEWFQITLKLFHNVNNCTTHHCVILSIHFLSELSSLIVGEVRKWCSFSLCFIHLRLDWSGLWPWGVSGKAGSDGRWLGAEGKSGSRYLPPPPGRCVSSSSPLSHRVTTLGGGVTGCRWSHYHLPSFWVEGKGARDHWGCFTPSQDAQEFLLKSFKLVYIIKFLFCTLHYPSQPFSNESHLSLKSGTAPSIGKTWTAASVSLLLPHGQGCSTSKSFTIIRIMRI